MKAKKMLKKLPKTEMQIIRETNLKLNLENKALQSEIQKGNEIIRDKERQLNEIHNQLTDSQNLCDKLAKTHKMVEDINVDLYFKCDILEKTLSFYIKK